jgi:hypothetical protein
MAAVAPTISPFIILPPRREASDVGNCPVHKPTAQTTYKVARSFFSLNRGGDGFLKATAIANKPTKIRTEPI